MSYVPALNTVENLAILYSRVARLDEAKKLYLRAQRGLGTVFRHSSRRYENIVAPLADLGIDRA
jgi:hypothetical protein